LCFHIWHIITGIPFGPGEKNITNDRDGGTKMIIDIAWKAFERTGNTQCYVEYVKCKDIYSKINEDNVSRKKCMNKTG
jgi:hypothetical protein